MAGRFSLRGGGDEPAARPKKAETVETPAPAPVASPADTPTAAPKAKAKRSENRQRTEQFRVRLMPEEKAKLEANAAAHGLDVAAFIRLRTLGTKGARTRNATPTPDLVAWAEWRAQLGYIGNNLNQLTRLANMGDLDRPAELDRLLSRVEEMLEEARNAMRPTP